MKVKELIESLKSQDPEASVIVWGAYRDIETNEVYVSITRDGAVMISSDG